MLPLVLVIVTVVIARVSDKNKGIKEKKALTNCCKLIYTYLLSPLASIPNAGILAPVSRLLWEFPTDFRGKLTLELPELHKKLGK